MATCYYLTSNNLLLVLVNQESAGSIPGSSGRITFDSAKAIKTWEKVVGFTDLTKFQLNCAILGLSWNFLKSVVA